MDASGTGHSMEGNSILKVPFNNILAHHRLDLRTFPDISRMDPFTQRNLTQINFTAQGQPVTLLTPCPSPMRSRAVPPGAGTSSATPSVSMSGPLPSAPSTSPLPSGSSVSAPPPPRTIITSSSQYPNLPTVLPIFSLVPGRSVSWDVVPFLQASLLGIVNDNIRSYNEIKELVRGLDLPPMPSRSLYTSPYQTQTSTFTSAPPPHSNSIPHIHFSEPPAQIISSTTLLDALAHIHVPSPSDAGFAVMADLIGDIATSSGVAGSLETESGGAPEIAPIGTLQPVPTSLARVFTSSEIVSTSAVDASLSSPEPSSLTEPSTTPSSSSPPIIPYQRHRS